MYFVISCRKNPAKLPRISPFLHFTTISCFAQFFHVFSCDFGPCQNGGTCVNSQDFQSYTCNCLIEYTGSSCEVPIPCLVNGIIDCGVAGVCENQPDYSDYYCECDGYHMGDNCEIEIVFPPGQDPNSTIIDDFFLCNWEDTFCIIYLQASIVL